MLVQAVFFGWGLRRHLLGTLALPSAVHTAAPSTVHAGWGVLLKSKPQRSAAYWLTASWLAQPAFLWNQDHWLRDGTAYHELSPPPSITKMPYS